MLKEGSQLKVACSTLQGSSPLEFSWFKNGGEKLVSGSDQEINTIENTFSSLIIKKIDARHAGSYTCSVRNSHGQDRMSVVLKVKCKI